MTITRNELATALTDVRRAYRLVQTYQRRLWDLLAKLDQALGDAGISFERWMPVKVWPPPKAGTKFFAQRWAWDFMPAYQLGCAWEHVDPRKRHARRVFVIATADTGFEVTSGDEPDPASFRPAEECATTLQVGLWTAATGSPNWDDAVQVRDAKGKVRGSGTYKLQVKGTPYECQLLLVDVAELVDEEAVKAQLLEPIAAWLAASKPG